MGILLFDFCKRRNARLVFTTVETSFWQLSLGGPLLENYWRKRFSRVNSLLLLHFIVGHVYVILHLFFPYIPIPEGRTRWLPLLVAFPLDTDKSPVYEILYAMLTWNMLVSIYGTLLFDFLFVYAGQHLCAQFMLLGVLLKKLESGLMEGCEEVEKFKSVSFQEEVCTRLATCANHHTLLLR
jgi:hypothetical protein